MVNRHSFVTRLHPRGKARQFGKKVEDGETPEILRPVSRRYKIGRSPRDHEWTPGEPVVLVSLTGAGIVPTSIFGIFQGFTTVNGRKAAMVCWEQKAPCVSSTVAVQRIRPVSLIPR